MDYREYDKEANRAKHDAEQARARAKRFKPDSKGRAQWERHAEDRAAEYRRLLRMAHAAHKAQKAKFE